MPKLPGLRNNSFSAHAQINEVEKELQDSLQRISELETLYQEAKAQSSQLLKLDQILRDPAQVRKYFNPDTIAGLVESIKQYGILEPLIVRPLPDGMYKLVAGERRYRAAQQAGLSDVPVTIREMDDTEAIEISLVENLQRDDLNPVEQTEGILQLLSCLLRKPEPEVTSLLYSMFNEHLGKSTNNVVSSEALVVHEVFKRVAAMEWKSFVTHRLPLLKLPQNVLEALSQGQIEYTKARAIAQVKDEDARRILLNDAIKDDLSLMAIKEQIKDLKQEQKQDKKPLSVNTLKIRFKDVTGKVMKLSSSNWQDPKKAQRISKLLDQLEALVES